MMLVNCLHPTLLSVLLLSFSCRLAVPTFLLYIYWHVQTIGLASLALSFWCSHSIADLQYFNPHRLQSFLEKTCPIQKHLARVAFVQQLNYDFKSIKCRFAQGHHSPPCLDCGFADSKLNWAASVEWRLCACSAAAAYSCWLPGADVTVRSAARWLCGTLRLGTCYRCFPLRR